MQKLFIVDSVGKSSGMHLYDELMYNLFKREYAVEVVSNYRSGYASRVLTNFYLGNPLQKVVGLLLSMVKFLQFYHRQKGIYIYQSFGMRFIDMIFIMLMFRKKQLVVLVHDIYPITESRRFFAIVRNVVYRHFCSAYVTHSREIRQRLMSISPVSRVIYTPHFRYTFDKVYEKGMIRPEVYDLVCSDKLNLLLFGSMRETKGLGDVCSAMRFASSALNVNIIVAGKNKEDQLEKHYQGLDERERKYFSILDSHINDDEMKYLFQKMDYLLLPYTEINQSGIMDIGINYRKKMIFSDLAYFKKILQTYRSFGYMFARGDLRTLARILSVLRKDDVISLSEYNEYVLTYEEDAFLNAMGRVWKQQFSK